MHNFHLRYGNQDVVTTPLTRRYANSTSALGSCYCVTANSTTEQAQACIDFLGLLFTDSHLADLYTFGIEGEDFIYDDNGHVEQVSEKYSHSMWESASATAVTPTSYEPGNQAELYSSFNSGAATSCAAGFRFDNEPVEAQFIACQWVFEEIGFLLENGGVPESEVEAVIAAYYQALNEGGFQDIINEAAAQYEAWKELSN